MSGGEVQWETERACGRGGESSTSEVLPSQARFAVLGSHVTKPPETRRSPLCLFLEEFCPMSSIFAVEYIVYSIVSLYYGFAYAT